MPANTPRISRATALLLADLPLSRPTSICDVGADPVNVPPYKALLAAGGCRVTGFEPNPEAHARLMADKSGNETYHNTAVGDGSELTLHLFNLTSMTSVFPPDPAGLRAIGTPRWGQVNGTAKLKTVALDKMKGLDPFDCLKIDIQGGEVLVFRNAKRMLGDCVCVIVEARYLQLYQDEPMLGGVDQELRSQGFMLHRFLWNKSKMMPNSQAARLIRWRHNDQLVDGDAVYLRHPGHLDRWTDEQLMHGAILGSALFDSHSFVLFCLDELVRRGRADRTLPARYVDRLPAALRVADDPVRVPDRVARRRMARASRRTAEDDAPAAPDQAAE